MPRRVKHSFSTCCGYWIVKRRSRDRGTEKGLVSAIAVAKPLKHYLLYFSEIKRKYIRKVVEISAYYYELQRLFRAKGNRSGISGGLIFRISELLGQAVLFRRCHGSITLFYVINHLRTCFRCCKGGSATQVLDIRLTNPSISPGNGSQLLIYG